MPERKPLRLLALSATIGDFNVATTWLSRGIFRGSHDKNEKNLEPELVIAPDDGKEIRYRIKGYRLSPSAAGEERKEGEESAESSFSYVADLVRLFPSTSLVFANSKRMLEHLTYTVQKFVAGKKTQDRYRVHHGSLSRSEREDTEDALKTKIGTVTFCSSTLELGIDVGNVERVGQFGAPWSVSALQQRLGRSGRKDGEPSVMVLFVVDKSEQTSILERIYPELLQAVAMSELLFQRWCESPDVHRPHYSTLVQQCLSVVAEKGGLPAARLYEILVKKGTFSGVSRGVFMEILHGLGAHDLLEQTREGDLVLGLAGERIVRRYDFYAAFTTPQEIDVVHQGHKIGSIFLALDMIPEGMILLAGRRWKIRLIDMEKNTMTVEPAKGGKAPPFGGETGPEIHSRVRRKMFDVLAGEEVPRYLDPEAAKMLEDARRAAKDALLLDSPLAREKKNLLWLPWESSAVHRTLFALGLLAGMEVQDQDVALEFLRTDENELKEAYSRFSSSPPSIEEIAAQFEGAAKGQEKYDRYLPKRLLIESFGKRYLELPGAMKAIEEISRCR
jgi:ATP-dependent Lhr-like helicase